MAKIIYFDNPANEIFDFGLWTQDSGPGLSFARLVVTKNTPKMTNTNATGLFQVKISCPTAMAKAAVMKGCRLLYMLTVVGRIRRSATGRR